MMDKKTAQICPHHGTCLTLRINPLVHQINCLDMNRISDICVEDIPKTIDARFASLYILDESNKILNLKKCNHPYLINKIVSLSQKPPSPMVIAVKSKKLIVVNNVDMFDQPAISTPQRAYSENYNTKTCLIAPLICDDIVVGVLNLADKIGAKNFKDDDIAVVELLSQLAGTSIGNVMLFEKIQRQAQTDGLTGLVNHRRFYEVLERELWRSRRYGGQISLILIDIDNLKKINDTHGHRAGDKAIKTVSRRIKSCIRQIDTASRYGGDEFAVILPNTSLEKATVVGQRMVDMVAKSPIVWNKEQIKLSISVGLGRYDAYSSPEDITSNSDRALYTAKLAGKNTVKIFESLENNN